MISVIYVTYNRMRGHTSSSRIWKVSSSGSVSLFNSLTTCSISFSVILMRRLISPDFTFSSTPSFHNWDYYFLKCVYLVEFCFEMGQKTCFIFFCPLPSVLDTLLNLQYQCNASANLDGPLSSWHRNQSIDTETHGPWRSSNTCRTSSLDYGWRADGHNWVMEEVGDGWLGFPEGGLMMNCLGEEGFTWQRIGGWLVAIKKARGLP